MNGDELAIRLREQMEELPLVLVAVTAMSSTNETTNVSKTRDSTCTLVKPVDPHQLVLVLDTLWRAWLGGR